MVSYNKALSSTSSSLSSSLPLVSHTPHSPAPSDLRPPCLSGSYFYCSPSHRLTAFFSDCGFSSPPSPAFPSSPLPFADCNRRHLVFFYFISLWREALNFFAHWSVRTKKRKLEIAIVCFFLLSSNWNRIMYVFFVPKVFNIKWWFMLEADTKEFLLPSKLTEVDHEPKYVFTPSQSYSAVVWMGSNWAQPICWAPWMCYLAETFFSFFFSYFFLFFSAGKWWRSSGQCSQVSPSFYTGAMPSVCACVCKSYSIKKT